MDMDWTNVWVYDAGYRMLTGDPVLLATRLGFGTALVDHAMSNQHKPNRGMLEAKTDSTARSMAAVGSLSWRLGERSVLETGLDVTRLTRDAKRTRLVVASGQQQQDRLWPDARQRMTGAFAELRWHPAGTVRVRAGGRVDHVRSTAYGIDEPGMGGVPIRDAYTRFYGASAADGDGDEVVTAGNLLIDWTFRDGLSAYGGAGTSARPAGITERYFAFAPAPGGYQVGNPQLAPERKNTLVWGARWRLPMVNLGLSSHASRVSNYILPTIVARQDVNSDGSEDLIRGFRNVDATLFGGELQVEPHLTKQISLPTSFAVVYGHNTTDDRPLPEIPPWELEVALRGDFEASLPWWAEVGGRCVGEQDRVDAEFGENSTPGFFVAEVRAGVRLFERFDLEGAIENVFNANYHEHLTRESVFTVGGLNANGEIPAPGRSVHVGVRALL
jgi:iron complex outermembrane receptor protein